MKESKINTGFKDVNGKKIKVSDCVKFINSKKEYCYDVFLSRLGVSRLGVSNVVIVNLYDLFWIPLYKINKEVIICNYCICLMIFLNINGLIYD